MKNDKRDMPLAFQCPCVLGDPNRAEIAPKKEG